MTPTNNSDAFGVTDSSATVNPNLMDVDMDTPTRIRPGSYAHLEKLCPRCRRWIGIGAKGSLYPFVRHLDGERCHHATEPEAQQDESFEIPVAGTSFVPELVPSHAIPPISSYPHVPLPGSTSEFLQTQPTFPYPDFSPVANSSSFLSLTPLSPLSLPGHTSCISRTTPDTMGLNTLEVPPTPFQVLPHHPGLLTTTKIPCRGVPVNWECGHPLKTYPFQYHDTDNPTWSVMTPHPPNPNIIYLQSFFCALFHDSSAEACLECLKVPSSDKFRSMVLKASEDPAPTIPYIYLSWEQISKRLKDKTNECRRYYKRVSFISPR